MEGPTVALCPESVSKAATNPSTETLIVADREPQQPAPPTPWVNDVLARKVVVSRLDLEINHTQTEIESLFRGLLAEFSEREKALGDKAGAGHLSWFVADHFAKEAEVFVLLTRDNASAGGLSLGCSLSKKDVPHVELAAQLQAHQTITDESGESKVVPLYCLFLVRMEKPVGPQT